MATALYRRYRPETFADVIGQEHVTGPLMQALRTGRVGHAYLFSGPRGCGKTTSARILARCLNCEQGPTPEPCGTCDSCLALARGGPGHVDVIEIDAASHGGVDDARDLRERASYGPAQSRYKVYVIDEAHMVTPQGFNALLKIVEEPPEHVKFVFATTEPEKVIGTIRSRTHHYPFRLVPPAQLIAYMERLLQAEGVAAEPGVLSFVSRAGGGSVRDSLSVLDQLIAGSGPEGLTYAGAVSLLGFTDGELLDATVDALAAGDGAATFRQIDKVIESGHDPRRFVEDLLERLRDLIIVAAVPDGVGQVLRGVPEDQLERMRVQQAAFGPGALSRAADIVNTGLTEMTGANSPRLQLELICARVLLPAASGEQGYAARLDRIERRLEMGGLPSPRRGSGAAVPSAARPAGMPPGEPPIGRGPSGTAGAPPVAPVRTAPVVPARGPATPNPAPGPAPNSASNPAPSSKVTGPNPTASSVHEPGSPDAPARSVATASGPGALDTDAIRRAWPDVLGRVYRMRRITWTFVSQNAQVIGYDGSSVTLGIATEGLTQTFRSGNHAEVVRQALIDQLGIDATVVGIYVADGSVRQTEPGPPPESTSSARADAGPTRPAGQALETNAGWGSASGPAPDWATAGPAKGPTAAGPAVDRAAADTMTASPPAGSRAASGAGGAAEAPRAPTTTPADRPASPTGGVRRSSSGPSVVRASLDAARRGSRPGAANQAAASVTADSGVSDDDEDIEVSTDVGRSVIEKVLGGRVISELDE